MQEILPLDVGLDGNHPFNCLSDTIHLIIAGSLQLQNLAVSVV